MIVIVACLATLPYMSSRQANDTLDALKTGASKERAYNAVLTLLKDAETGQRGYLLGSDESFLEPYKAGVGGMPAALDELRRLAAPEERALVEKVAALSEAKIAEMAETIRLKKSGQAQAAVDRVASQRGKILMDELRVLLGRQLGALAEHRSQLREEITAALRYNIALAIGASLACLVVIGSALYIAARSLRERSDAARQAQTLAASNALLAEQAAVRAERLSLTAQMLQALDSVKSPLELGQVLPVFLRQLLPETSGAVYLYRNSRDFLEPKAQWGMGDTDMDLVTPDDCWGLRLGRTHRAANGHDLCCAHGHSGSAAGVQICVPMISQGEVIGLMVLHAPSQQATGVEPELVATVAEQLGLAVSNVSLRESLRQQSTVDPLTGMYNRRFFDESLKRELLRARRTRTACAVVMVDLDHFKRINDTYGHEGGDLILKAAARVLLERVRASDIASRYGGEEFVLLLPDCSADAALKCAEQIRHALTGLAIPYLGQTISVTASLGVAAWPQHADGEQELLKAADLALYEAKKSGRNRVVAAPARSDAASA
ncbi:diguanylate cyclase [Massilia agri]|uniref:diguanylate cyclase n=1 Tax=Massilia agri TaxID=1886785 RepID=A0ABT2ASL2_9BURK|nr:diguanylate cyclase [Massilia agri]MCS0599237.1 diguanylate cyclase [Massilia agri]